MHLLFFERSDLSEKLAMIVIGCRVTAILLQPNACSSFQAIVPVAVFFPKLKTMSPAVTHSGSDIT